MDQINVRSHEEPDPVAEELRLRVARYEMAARVEVERLRRALLAAARLRNLRSWRTRSDDVMPIGPDE